MHVQQGQMETLEMQGGQKVISRSVRLKNAFQLEVLSLQQRVSQHNLEVHSQSKDIEWPQLLSNNKLIFNMCTYSRIQN